MGKHINLADIYIRLYNKKPLTMDDLIFLSKYDPECFEKTCQNLIYNVPQTEKLMQPDPESENETGFHEEEGNQNTEGRKAPEPKTDETETISEQMKIQLLLDNLRKMEKDEFDVQACNAESVKKLLGNLYMEMLFPHNEKTRYFQMLDYDPDSTFNKKA